MTVQRPPIGTRRPPAGDRSLAGSVAAVALMIGFVALLWNPVVTTTVVVTVFVGVVFGKRVVRVLGRRLDGVDRSVHVPGIGTFDVRFTTH